MYKSTLVNLVFLNSILVLSGCSSCRTEEKIDEKGNKVVTGCTGARGGRGGVYFFPHTSTGTGFRSGGSTGSGSPSGSTGSVSRGGFGSSGGAVS